MKHLSYLLLALCFSCYHTAYIPIPEKSARFIPSVPQSEILHQVIPQTDLAYIWISKSTYILELRADTVTLARFPMVLGGNPVDDKRMQGDKSTPEGIFSIRDLYPHKKWSKFIWIDYPTAASWEKHEAAKRKGLIPQTANIGGEIGIHGVPEGYDSAIDAKQNWTLGCISLKTSDINWLYDHVYKGMKVEIVP